MKTQFQNKLRIYKLQGEFTSSFAMFVYKSQQNTCNGTNEHWAWHALCIFRWLLKDARDQHHFFFSRIFMKLSYVSICQLPSCTQKKICELYHLWYIWPIGHFNKKILFFSRLFDDLLFAQQLQKCPQNNRFANEQQFNTHLLCLFCTHARFLCMGTVHWVRTRFLRSFNTSGQANRNFVWFDGVIDIFILDSKFSSWWWP